MNKEQRKEYLEKMFTEVMNHHTCGNYIGIEDDDDIEWYTNSDDETFVAFTKYGTYHYHYDWDFSYDANLQAFVEDVIEFVRKEGEQK